MVFLDLLHQEIGLQVIPQLDPQIGTDIQHMIDHMKQNYPDKLLSRKDFLFQRFMIYGDELKEYQNKFLERVEQYYSQKK